MKTITLFSFDELSAEAQRTAVRCAELKEVFVPNWEIDRDDAANSFLAISKELDFEVGRNGIIHHKYIGNDIAGSRLKAMIRQDYGNFFPPKSKHPEISGYWADSIILNPLVEFLNGYPGYAGYTMWSLIRDINAAYDKLIDDLWSHYTDRGVEELLRDSDEFLFTESGFLIDSRALI